MRLRKNLTSSRNSKAEFDSIPLIFYAIALDQEMMLDYITVPSWPTYCFSCDHCISLLRGSPSGLLPERLPCRHYQETMYCGTTLRIATSSTPMQIFHGLSSCTYSTPLAKPEFLIITAPVRLACPIRLSLLRTSEGSNETCGSCYAFRAKYGR